MSGDVWFKRTLSSDKGVANASRQVAARELSTFSHRVVGFGIMGSKFSIVLDRERRVISKHQRKGIHAVVQTMDQWSVAQMAGIQSPT